MAAAHGLHGFAERDFTEQHGGEADVVGDVEEGVDAGAAQVAVDDDDALADIREGDGQVGDGGGLALGGAGAGDLDDPQRPVEPEEADGRAQ